ncbi:MAG: tRNA (N(6)-L-threonylcarbamoyladenosine(37)-C(2))-methylthiotransferase MtaB [Clostridiales bacterium]|nr:tRNA (N(6)-L-threonylcarbamoyladenosine(37)-C(2))-methylthiotransferase MtaB [Clostridiales bacterium]
MRAAIYTLGCKVNQYETREIAQLLTNNGYFVVNHKENADVYIVNSCTVTAESTRKTRQAVRHLKTLHPNSVVVLTGCVPQAFPEEALSVNEADIIIGNKNNGKIVSVLNKYFENHKAIRDIEQHDNDEEFSGTIISEFSGHTRAFVKIQDGCDRFCSYCAIPYARGRSRSKKADVVKDEVHALSKNGFKEIVFVGINLSSYGRDIGLTIADPIKIAENTDGVERIRLGSLEPDHITDDIIAELSQCSKLCPQFHISLQSGSNSVLKRMNRHYTAEEYCKIAENLRKAFPDASITTDIIVGFPGETDEEFKETVEFVKKVRFEKVHVFPFSVRPGTRAAKMENQISNETKNKRASQLTEVCNKIRAEIFASMIGKSFSVLFEAPKKGLQCGYTKNYTPVRIKSGEKLTGLIANVKITGCTDEYCIGEETEI